tara:strand:+ start:638 stop:931 length:294 start_codon:yes stop_codon:yes gene_type:complete
MEIDSTLIRDSQKAKRWSYIPILSQGQMYNGKYLKSLFFVCSQSYSLNRMLYYNQFDNNDDIVKRNKAAWWFIGMYVSSIIDSYIDAELSGFSNKGK